MKLVGILVGCINSIDLEDGTNLLQTGILQHHTQVYDFDTTKWEHFPGYQVYEQNGQNADECYPTLSEAMTKCGEAGDCGGIATQTTFCGGQFRISHGGPHLYGPIGSHNVQAWVIKFCTQAPGIPYTLKGFSSENCSDYSSAGVITTTTTTTACLTGICVSSAACGATDVTATIGVECNGKTECLVEVTKANSPVSLVAEDQVDDFDTTIWEHFPGYQVYEQNGQNADECYPTLSEAMTKCGEAGDCGGIATQTTFCGGQFRISHGGPHLYGPIGSHNVQAWVLKFCTKAPGIPYTLKGFSSENCSGYGSAVVGPPGCKDAYTVSYSCADTKVQQTATISKPSAGKTTTLVCAAATTTPAPGGTTATTTNPGGPTNPGGKDCFAAIAEWGPDFECNSDVSSFCADDSADGLDVSACCQDYCNSNQEKRLKKKESELNRKEAEGERKSKRKESRSKRSDAESTRKKKRKEEEWLAKRGAQETSNKKEEDERKTKRGYSESKKKNERSWKGNRAKAKKAAQLREVARKAGRAESARKNANSGSESGKKNKRKENKQKKKAAWKAKKEKRQKNQGKNGRKGRKFKGN